MPFPAPDPEFYNDLQYFGLGPIFELNCGTDTQNGEFDITFDIYITGPTVIAFPVAASPPPTAATPPIEPDPPAF